MDFLLFLLDWPFLAMIFRNFMMKIHILGICGTFMGGIAIIAKEMGFEVSGSDANVYPPMSDQLRAQGIKLYEGYDPKLLEEKPDGFIIGNALSRGNPFIEYILNENLPYQSGPEWLADNILSKRWVLAVAGTHGKTTTTSMLAWILTHCGKQPGFLIGGVAENFSCSATVGSDPYFVIEADEYDTAYFDKRPKFIHYNPRTLILNNLEFDHADIYTDLAAIQLQFHYLVRLVPGNGLLICPDKDDNLQEALAKGVYSPIEYFGQDADYSAEYLEADGSHFTVNHRGKKLGEVAWKTFGAHNVQNAMAAVIAAQHIGIPVQQACQALSVFSGVKRRLQVRGEVRGVTVYDDFAHHPTAIAVTLNALRQRVGNDRIIAVVDFASATMAAGVHLQQIAPALQQANSIILAKPANSTWSFDVVTDQLQQSTKVFTDVADIVTEVSQQAQAGDHILIMSNKGFGGVHAKLLTALEKERAHDK